MKALSAHRLARAMLILSGWHTPMRIGREMGLYHRTSMAHWLKTLRRDGLVERRRTGRGGGYEWRLTSSGNAFAIALAPFGDDSAPTVRYDHRALTAALGMPHTITPPAGRVHTLEGKGAR